MRPPSLFLCPLSFLISWRERADARGALPVPASIPAKRSRMTRPSPPTTMTLQNESYSYVTVVDLPAAACPLSVCTL
jgi:hypothetical protein